jgi:hypothetical protein
LNDCFWCDRGKLCRNPFSTIKLSHEQHGQSRAGAALGTFIGARHAIATTPYGFELARRAARDIHGPQKER